MNSMILINPVMLLSSNHSRDSSFFQKSNFNQQSFAESIYNKRFLGFSERAKRNQFIKTTMRTSRSPDYTQRIAPIAWSHE
jgi:hypothetical protein